MMASYEAVVEYVFIQMGGFHIDGWHIKAQSKVNLWEIES